MINKELLKINWIMDKVNSIKSTFIFLTFIFIFSFSLHAQWTHPYLESNKIDQKNNLGFYSPNPDTTVYEAIHTLFSTMEPISYLNFVPVYNKKFINPSVDRLTPESRSQTDTIETMRLEINFYIPWTIIRGRAQSNNWLQASRLTLDYWGSLRIAGRTSSPITPPTNAFGFSWEFAPLDNFRSRGKLGYRKLLNGDIFDKRNFWKDHDKPIYKMISTQFKLMHYSNGQAPGFFVEGDNINHDYLGGDFSTNFFLTQVGYHQAHKSGRIFSIWGGYRYDFQLWPGLLTFAEEQENSYGRNRLLFNFQFISKPKFIGRMKESLRDYINPSKERFNILNYCNLQFRTEMVWILGNLDKWRMVGSQGRKYRFGIKQVMKINFLRARSLGLNAIYYYGRDYLNIRFDNIVHTFSLGLNFKLNKNSTISFPRKRQISIN